MNVDYGHIYVLAFDNGTVKVGRTQDVRQRLGAHRSGARKFGLTIAREWVSPCHAEWRQNEDGLKALAVTLGGIPLSAEYFKDVDFDALAARALELPYTARPDRGTCRVYIPTELPDSQPLSLRERAIWNAALRMRVAEAEDAFRQAQARSMCADVILLRLMKGDTLEAMATNPALPPGVAEVLREEAEMREQVIGAEPFDGPVQFPIEAASGS